MTDTMKALRAHTRGGPEQLVYEDAPVPTPGPGEALVAVGAAAITFAELGWDLSWTRLDGSDRTPVIPSHEVSGTVAGLGADVSTDVSTNASADGSTVGIGDQVYGLINFDRDGAAAEYAVVPVEHLARKPESVGDVDAAALPLAALTAWQALHDHAGLKPGETVLVHGGAGGVGVYGVQVARLLGASVIATGRSDSRDFVLGLGAGRFIDVGSEDFDRTTSDVDVVLDTVGGSTLERSFAVLRRGGRLVTLGGPPPAGLADQHGVSALFFVVSPDRTQLRRLAGYVDSGELKPVVSRTFGLRDGRAAYESGHLRRKPGKTVLVVR